MSAHLGPRTAAVVEDCEWMARTGEGLTMAAARLGYTSPITLERTLSRAGRNDLVAALKAPELAWMTTRMSRERAA